MSAPNNQLPPAQNALLHVILFVLQGLWLGVKLLFSPVSLAWSLLQRGKRARWLSAGKERLAFMGPEDVAPALAARPPRRVTWHGAAVAEGAPDRDYYLDLLLRGHATPAVVVGVEREQHEDFSIYVIAYVLRRPNGELELVIDHDGARDDPARPAAMYRYREKLMWSLNAQPGDTFTALINLRGDHVIFETLDLLATP